MINIKETCENMAIIMAEAAGGPFTGAITFVVEYHQGGITKVVANRSGELVAGQTRRFGKPLPPPV